MCLNLNQVGLLLDIIGVALLFANGLSFHFSDTFGYLLLKDDEDLNKTEKYKKMERRYKIMSRLYIGGLVFVIAGFICQLFYNAVP